MTNSSPLRTLLASAGLEFITVVVSALVGFALTPYMIRTLGDRDYGLFVLIGSLTGWFGFVDLGLSSAVTRYVAVSFAARDIDDCKAYTNTAFFVYLGLGGICLTIGCVIAGLLAGVLPDNKDASLIPVLVVLAALTFAIQLPLRALAGLISGCMRRDRTSLLRLCGRLSLSAVTFLVLWLDGRLLALSIATLLASLTSCVVWWKTAKATLPSLTLNARTLQKDRVQSLLKFGGIAFVGNIAEAVLLRADSLIITTFLAVAAVTHFNIAVTLAAIYQTVMVALTAWLMNWFAHTEKQGNTAVARNLLLATRVAVLCGGFCLFGLVAWGRPFIQRWVGTEYVDVYWSLVALSTAVFVRVIQFPNNSLLFAVARHRQFAAAKVVEGLLNVLIGVLLVRRYGLTGVAIGTLAASLVANGILLPWSSSATMTVQLLTYYRSVFESLFAVAIAVIIPGILSYSLAAPDYGTLIFLGCISAVAYFPVAGLLATSTTERRAIMKATLAH